MVAAGFVFQAPRFGKRIFALLGVFVDALMRNGSEGEDRSTEEAGNFYGLVVYILPPTYVYFSCLGETNHAAGEQTKN